jgi:hypothetical protein
MEETGLPGENHWHSFFTNYEKKASLNTLRV